METWFIILVSISIAMFLRSLFNLHKPTVGATHNLPPGPPTLPIIGNLLWFQKSLSEIEAILQNLRAKYGPIIILHYGFRPHIFISSHSLAHRALVQNGAVFADRPPGDPTSKLFSRNQHDINSSFYGPTWRLFRRNITSEMFNPSRIKSYSHTRKWVLEILINQLRSCSKSGEDVHARDLLQYATFCLLVLMCFGDKLDEKKIKEIEQLQRHMLLSLSRFSIPNVFPSLTRFLFRKRWEELFELRRYQEKVLIPLVRARKNVKHDNLGGKENEFVVSYVDTLLDLQLPDEKRKLEEGEIVGLCSEFLHAGTDTTSTALQWIMANLVKHPHVQEKLFVEIKGVMGDAAEEEVKDDKLQEIPYLKAVIFEGLRRHPPGHFVLPHAVTQDTVLDGFVIPKDCTVNFMVAEMGLDPQVWEDPVAFKPERFLNGEGEGIDITGGREIKMMPFGAGRRICPAYGLALHHLEYFVANLVWNFEWIAVEGDPIDLSEKEEFTTVMKNPLKAQVSPRMKA